MDKEQRIEYRTQLIIPNDAVFRDMGKVYRTMGGYKRAPLNLDDEYGDLLGEFMDFIFEQMLLGHTVKLPFRCGTLHIFGRKVSTKGIEDGFIGRKENGKRRYSVDWGKTNKINANYRDKFGMRLKDSYDRQIKLVYNTLEATNGIRYKVFWNKWRTNLNNQHSYKFTLCKPNKRLLGEVVNDGQEYIVINPDQNVDNNVMAYNTMSYFLDNIN